MSLTVIDINQLTFIIYKKISYKLNQNNEYRKI